MNNFGQTKLWRRRVLQFDKIAEATSIGVDGKKQRAHSLTSSARGPFAESLDKIIPPQTREKQRPRGD